MPCRERMCWQRQGVNTFVIDICAWCQRILKYSSALHSVSRHVFSRCLLTILHLMLMHDTFQIQVLPGYWRGQDMFCEEDSCNTETGVCNPTFCYKENDARRIGCKAGSCKTRVAMVYRWFPFVNPVLSKNGLFSLCGLSYMLQFFHRCPPGVCVQEEGSTCLKGHTGPLCSICAPNYAMQSGACRDCGVLGVWPQVIAAVLALLIFIFLILFSWFPLLPDRVQQLFDSFRGRIGNEAAKTLQDKGGAVNGTEDTEAEGKICLYQLFQMS